MAYYQGILDIRTGSITKQYVKVHLIGGDNVLIPHEVIDLIFRLCDEDYNLLYLALIEYGSNMSKYVDCDVTPEHSDLDSKYLPHFNDKTVALYKYFRGWIRNTYLQF